MSQARAWLEIMRISNAPTVVSNAIAGATIGVSLHPDGLDRWREIPPSTYLALAAPTLAYTAGMILNDAFDARIDARERPRRPIPSGRIARTAAFAAGAGLLVLAVALCAAAGSSTALLLTIALSVCVLVYNAVHAVLPASVLLLAACRALAVLVPLSAFQGEPGEWGLATWSLPVAVAVWTVGLSILARGEVVSPTHEGEHAAEPTTARGGHGVRLPGPIELAVPGFFAGVVSVATVVRVQRDDESFSRLSIMVPLGIALVGAFLALRAWHRLCADPRETPRSVGRLIVCLCFIDAIFATVIGNPAIGAACLALALVADRLQRRIAGS